MTRQTTAKLTAALLGTWIKGPGEPCTERYPAQLTLGDRNLYTGQTDPPGGFTWWDAGTWRVRPLSRIELSTATDEVETYEVRLIDDGSAATITIVDNVGCSLTYRRG